MKIRYLAILALFTTVIFSACDSSKQGPEENAGGKPSTEAVKERPSGAPTDPSALAKVAER